MVQLNARFTLLLALCLAVVARPATNGIMAEVGPLIDHVVSLLTQPCSANQLSGTLVAFIAPGTTRYVMMTMMMMKRHVMMTGSTIRDTQQRRTTTDSTIQDTRRGRTTMDSTVQDARLTTGMTPPGPKTAVRRRPTPPALHTSTTVSITRGIPRRRIITGSTLLRPTARPRGRASMLLSSRPEIFQPRRNRPGRPPLLLPGVDLKPRRDQIPGIL